MLAPMTMTLLIVSSPLRRCLGGVTADGVALPNEGTERMGQAVEGPSGGVWAGCPGSSL